VRAYQGQLEQALAIVRGSQDIALSGRSSRAHPPYAEVAGIAPHNCRRTCAKSCRAAGGELEQIQMLLAHASVQTTERYLGTKQDFVHAPSDRIS